MSGQKKWAYSKAEGKRQKAKNSKMKKE